MRAVLCREWGDLSVLAVEEVKGKASVAGWVRISVRAAGINFADNLMVSGRYQFKTPFPFSPGFEASGVVAEVGEGVGSTAVGDRVMVALPHGGFVEEVLAPATSVFRIPEVMDFRSAAAFPVAYGTVHLALVHRARLQRGQILLVHGAGGNVGRASVEVGKRLGATVLATAGSARSLEVARGRGADHLLRYGSEDVRDRVLELTGGDGADVVFDPWGATSSMPRCGASPGRDGTGHRVRRRADPAGTGLATPPEELRRDRRGLGRLPQARTGDREVRHGVGAAMVLGRISRPDARACFSVGGSGRSPRSSSRAQAPGQGRAGERMRHPRSARRGPATGWGSGARAAG